MQIGKPKLTEVNNYYVIPRTNCIIGYAYILCILVLIQHTGLDLFTVK